MSTHRTKLVLLAGLTAAASLPSAPTAAATPPPEQRIDTAVPLDIQGMTALFLASNPTLRADQAFERDWTVTTKCIAWTKLSTDEFRSSPFLKAGATELAASHESPPSNFEVRFSRFLGRYDAAKREFDLRTLGAEDVLPVRVEGFDGEGHPGGSFRAGCQPTSGRYPVEFDVTFDNSPVANGLPMSPDAAAAFAQARTYPNGSRNNAVAVALKLRLTLGTPRPVNPVSAVKGVVVPVTAHIEDVTVEDGTPQRKPIYRLDDAKRQAGQALAAEAKEQARVEASVKPLDGTALRAQFDMERAGARVGPEPYRVGMQTTWSKRAAPPDVWSFALRPTDAFSMGNGVSLHFDNAAEVSATPPPAQMKQAFDKFQVGRVSLIYVPVGASDDPLKGGQFVMGHVLAIETQDWVDGVRRVSTVPLASNAVPWKLQEDTRMSDAFDVLGIKTGMAPGEVSAIAATELGQKLTFDEAKGEIHSSASDCDFEVARGRQPPPLGRRCLIASFLRTGAASPWTLARVRLTQSIGADRQKATLESMVAKYGKPDLAAPFDGPPSLSDLEGTDPARMLAVGWGARLVNVRPERDGVPFPLHPLEATTKTIGDETFVGITVTDWAAMNASNDAKAAAARRASEAVTPKF
jgi:hypothetical protein